MRVRHATPCRWESARECHLHWPIFEEIDAAWLDDCWWAHSTTVGVEGARFRVLCPADQFLRVCVRGPNWTPTPAIRRVANAPAILRAGGPDWPSLVAGARAGRDILSERDQLCYLSTIMSTPFLVEVLRSPFRVSSSTLARLERRLGSLAHPITGELSACRCHYARTRPAAVRPSLTFAPYPHDARGLGTVADLPRRTLPLAARRLTAQHPPSPVP